MESSIPVRGSDDFSVSFSEEVTPASNGHINYVRYRQQVETWLFLTSIAEKKRGHGLIGRLSGEAFEWEMTLIHEKISNATGVVEIWNHLDKS